jgi:putative ABC transport system permease protein
VAAAAGDGHRRRAGSLRPRRRTHAHRRAPAPGITPAAWLQALQLPADVQAAEPADAGQRVDALSRAYRVNLTVLALVALFTGAFLVFSVLALSVARRAQQLALLGVLGLTARQRLRLVLAESRCSA